MIVRNGRVIVDGASLVNDAERLEKSKRSILNNNLLAWSSPLRLKSKNDNWNSVHGKNCRYNGVVAVVADAGGGGAEEAKWEEEEGTRLSGLKQALGTDNDS